jgi:hypothetical protein
MFVDLDRSAAEVKAVGPSLRSGYAKAFSDAAHCQRYGFVERLPEHAYAAGVDHWLVYFGTQIRGF